jgi:transcriptional regulator with XRE-family HTH domain
MELVDFDLAGLVRRIRRVADLSQRELADRLGVSLAAIGHAEAGRRDLPTGVMVRAARLAGLRLAVLDENGREVDGMTPDAVRDAAGRRYPAHLDTRHGDEGWWYDDSRARRPTPWYTFDRARSLRDLGRQATGIPDDHQQPGPGDDPAERAALKAAEAAERRRLADEGRRAERQTAMARDRAAGVPTPGWGADPALACRCPPGCDAAREVLAEVHVPHCLCRCDVS